MKRKPRSAQPHAGKIARFPAICLLVAAILTLAAQAKGCARPVPKPAGKAPLSTATAPETFDRAVLEEVNFLRCQAGLGPVRPDPALLRAASGHSGWMAGAGRMDHTSDLPGRRDLGQRLKAVGAVLARAGAENIAMFRGIGMAGSPCPAAPPPPQVAEAARRVVAMWRDSPPHRANMLHPGVDRAGAAVALSVRSGTCGTVYMTLVLAG